MARRLKGIVVEAEAGPEAPIDYIGLGLKVFGHRSEIGGLIAQVRPILDVMFIQIPKILDMGKTLSAQLMPEWQTNLAASTGGIVAVFSVEWVQESLKSLGYYKSDVDGYFGPLSRDAVKRFQIDENLLPDEWPGKETCAAIQWRMTHPKAVGGGG